MNQNLLTGLGIGALGGCLIGYFMGAAHLFGEAPSMQPVAAASAPIAGPEAMNQLQAQQRILSAEAVVAKDPGNAQAWLSLGNDYFDLHQPQKSVAAYDKGLALSPSLANAPDILTDQGVMYRELKQFDRAIANFKRANQLNPRHLQSLINLGVVYAQDQHNPAAASEAWNKIIALDPNSPAATQARAAIASLRTDTAKL